MKKTVVLYDGDGLHEPHGGVSRYFTEVIKRLPEDIDPYITVRETRNVYLQAPPYNIPKARCSLFNFMPGFDFKGKGYVYRLLARFMPWKWPACELINKRAFKDAVKKGEFDLVHLTAPHSCEDNWSCIGQGKPIIVTVHDLIPEILYNNTKVRRFRASMFSKARHIVAVSENTKRDIVSLYGISEDRISVIHHGFIESEGQRDMPVFQGMRYILYVGKRGGYKNSDFYFISLAPLLRKDRSLNIVCTGDKFSQEELGLFAQEDIEKQVHQIFVPDNLMRSLYANALCFVYPSLYEGFGIPILEAFASKCPVILSNCSCFPEVAGDAALYFNKGDADTLRDNVSCLIGDVEKRQDLVSKGEARLKLFSWSKAAQETAEVYRSVLGK